ncbi:hypothetical protein BRY73_02935 [Ochrobactrum sp. P6BS-III]|nr:hypothetical protein [Ochrobactrum sp. P6BSIII]OOL20133.1 hypothetical protein BRY73_02935 [Ochrobactrum sp. P6BS-III]
MAETKFTPGPWDAAGYCGTEVYAGLKCIAQLPFGCGVDDHTLRTNARLIAAAPDLYDVVCKSDCPRPVNGRPDEFSALRCYEAGECGCFYGTALAKARGEAA